MRLALLISLAADRRSGRLHGDDLIPADQAVAKVKQLINGGKPLDPRFPIIAAVTVQSLREHRFSVSAEAVAKFEPEVLVAPSDELNAALASNAKLAVDLEGAQAKLKAAEEALAAAEQAKADLVSANDAQAEEIKALKAPKKGKGTE